MALRSTRHQHLRALLYPPALLVSSTLKIGMEKLQARLQAASAEYQKLQSDLSTAVDSRQRLDAQLQENEMVKKVRIKHICYGKAEM